MVGSPAGVPGWLGAHGFGRRWLYFGCGVNDEVSVAHRVVRDGELEHPVEHHPAAAGAAAGEAEHELIQVAGQVRGVDRALVRPSSHRLISEAIRCTAGRSAPGSSPRVRAARWLRRWWT